ncbi:MAG: hypothetical protein LBR79_01810 [Oscillospiraceae bacterium]|nr:hypothetical protein [Oscillospiraceae bacterium]
MAGEITKNVTILKGFNYIAVSFEKRLIFMTFSRPTAGRRWSCLKIIEIPSFPPAHGGGEGTKTPLFQKGFWPCLKTVEIPLFRLFKLNHLLDLSVNLTERKLSKKGCGPNLLIISFPPAIGGGKIRDFNYFGTRPEKMHHLKNGFAPKSR